MTAHLLAIAIGPVQDFIAAARRTRDLWFGSYLLSEISKAAAKVIDEAGGQLIFPAPPAKGDLTRDSGLSVANVILAELGVGLSSDRVQELAELAEKETRKIWKFYADAAKAEANSLINQNIWNEQVTDVIEFYAAWTPLNSPAQYPESRRRVMRLLAGRKACRDFIPAKGRSGVPKSSLDGARETVLIPKDQRKDILSEPLNRSLAQRLRLSPGEELDVIGLTKRAATRETFASVVRVAADPWIRGIEKDGGETADRLRQIADQCRLESRSDDVEAFATGTGMHHYQGIFPYDGSILYHSRLQSMIRASNNDHRVIGDFEGLLLSKDLPKLTEIKSLLEKLQKAPPDGLGYGEPETYLAVLVADGDRMGKAIAEIVSAEKHRLFSVQLATFAGEAKKIIEDDHSGCLVYSGGDDVLAFVPVDRCLDCARALHDRFADLMSSTKDLGIEAPPTLSVGLAIGHCMEAMEDLLEYGRAAEKAAKEPNRDGLAVHLYPRGGPPIEIHKPWSENLDVRLKKWAEMHRTNQIPDKAAYDLRELARQYTAWSVATPDQKEDLTKALRGDALRLIKRKRGNRGDAGLSDLEGLLGVVHSAEEIHDVANEVILSRRIAAAERQAEGRQSPGDTQEVGE